MQRWCKYKKQAFLKGKNASLALAGNSVTLMQQK